MPITSRNRCICSDRGERKCIWDYGLADCFLHLGAAYLPNIKGEENSEQAVAGRQLWHRESSKSHLTLSFCNWPETVMVTPPKHSDKDDYHRFVEMAQQIGSDESPEALERAFKRTVKAPAAAKPQQKYTPTLQGHS